LLISKGLQINENSSKVGSTVNPTPNHVEAFSSPLRSPRVPISTHTKGLVIIAKRKNHTRRQTQAIRVS